MSIGLINLTDSSILDINVSAFKEAEFATAKQVMTGVVEATVILTAVSGNLLVLVAIITEPCLKKKKSNIFLASLAFTDMLVGGFIMVFAFINDIHGRWLFGKDFCVSWVSSDLMFSTASIIHLCVICVDRYIQLIRPGFYDRNVTKRDIITIIIIIWFISALVAFVPMELKWFKKPPDQRRTEDPTVCIIDFSFIFAVVTSSVSFYIPCAIMLWLYLEIVIQTRHQERFIRRQNVKRMVSHTHSYVRPMKVSIRQTMHPPNYKVTITVGAMVGFFLICWLPFFIINPIAARCGTCIPPLMFQLFTWLGWANSCINPFIYSIFNRDFQRAFRRTLMSASNLYIDTERVSKSITKEAEVSFDMDKKAHRFSSYITALMGHKSWGRRTTTDSINSPKCSLADHITWERGNTADSNDPPNLTHLTRFYGKSHKPDDSRDSINNETKQPEATMEGNVKLCETATSD